MTPAGLPHSEIPGSQVVCTSPRLIAAYHVLHRFPEPRHPPYALILLDFHSQLPTNRGRCIPQRTDPRVAGNASLFRFHQLAWCALSKNHREPPRPWRAPLPTSRLDCSILAARLTARCAAFRCAFAPATLATPGAPARDRGPAGSGDRGRLAACSSSSSCRSPGGEYRARTGDLLVANQALSQLS